MVNKDGQYVAYSPNIKLCSTTNHKTDNCKKRFHPECEKAIR